MNMLILNAGSSSLKYKLFHNLDDVSGGLIEGIGETEKNPNHQQALMHVCQAINTKDIDVVGHRVVHGGTLFFKPTEINDANLAELKTLSYLAPLHNPANIMGIEIARQLLPNARHIAIFDTAFHHSLSKAAYTYALDDDMMKQLHIRRYGFHGISHQYVSHKACEILQRPITNTELISLHLGNGASACAIQHGHSIDTSMGMTPLEGLVMGTRSGDMDPAIVLLLAKQLGSIDAVDTLLNKSCGLKGICGDNDLRVIETRAKARDPAALLALEIMIHRLIKYIGSYMALLPNLNAIVFTGGIGENSHYVRATVLSRLAHLGIAFDADQNKLSYKDHARLTTVDSRIHAFAIRTNEELCMAQQILNL